MKRKGLLLACIAICLLIVFYVNPMNTGAASKTVKVKSLKVTNIDYSNYYSMRVTGTLKISTTISPSNATNKTITWTSSDKTVAKVSKKGVVTGVKRGFCKITGTAKDGSGKKVSFYVRVYSEKEFIYSRGWNYNDGEYGCVLDLSSTGEYTRYDISAGQEIISGLYTLDSKKKTITFSLFDGSNKEVWNYKIVTRSKLILSQGATQVTYTRSYKNKSITSTSKGFLYWPNGSKEASITDYVGLDKKVTIPSMIGERKVTSVSGFSGNTEIQQVILPDSVTSIGSFANCTKLKTITIPKGVKYLDSFAFENCKSLETIQLPAGLDVIGQGSFKGCTSLKSVKLPDQVVSVNREAFWNCTALESIYFPKGIEDIDEDILKGSNSVVIYGYQGTCAEDFAKINNLTFVER